MKRLISAMLFVIVSSVNPAFAEDDYMAPVPAPDDEVTLSGPDTKFSLATQMRFDAFQNAEISVPVDFSDDKKLVKIYQVPTGKDYLQRIKIPDAKITEFTNGSYDIRFKEIPDTVFSYDKNGDLISFAKLTNNGKIPFTTYHYDSDGKILEIEIKPERYRSYVYGLDGILTKYCIDDKVFAVNGKMLRRRKSFI